MEFQVGIQKRKCGKNSVQYFLANFNILSDLFEWKCENI